MKRKGSRIVISRQIMTSLIDALSAANSAGLKSDIEQIAFDASLRNAGGIDRLYKEVGLPFSDVKPCGVWK